MLELYIGEPARETWNSRRDTARDRAKPVNHIEQAVVGILRRTARCAKVDRSGEGRAHGGVSRGTQHSSILLGAMTHNQQRKISRHTHKAFIKVPQFNTARG